MSTSQFPVHLASSSITPTGFVHNSSDDNVVQLKEMMCVVCVCYRGGIVVMVVIWRQLCVSIILGSDLFVPS